MIIKPFKYLLFIFISTSTNAPFFVIICCFIIRYIIIWEKKRWEEMARVRRRCNWQRLNGQRGILSFSNFRYSKITYSWLFAYFLLSSCWIQSSSVWALLDWNCWLFISSLYWAKIYVIGPLLERALKCILIWNKRWNVRHFAFLIF